METSSVLNLESSESYNFSMNVCRLCGVIATDIGAPFFGNSKETHEFSPGTLIYRCFHPKISSAFFEMGISSDHLEERGPSGLPQNVCKCCVDRIREIWNFIKTMIHIQIRFQSLSGECEKKLSRDAIDYLSEVTIEVENQSGESEQLLVAPPVERFSENDPSLTSSRHPPLVNLNVKYEETEPDHVVDYEAVLDAVLEVDGESSSLDVTLSERKCRSRGGEKSLVSSSESQIPALKRGRRPRRHKTASPPFVVVPGGEAELADSSVLADDVVNVRDLPDASSLGSPAGNEMTVRKKNANVKRSVLGERKKKKKEADLDDGGGRLLKCVLCEKVILNFRALIRHFKELHDPSDAIQATCTNCGFLGTSCTLWRLHVRRSHASCKSKDVTCPACGRRFPNNHGLKRHMLIHSGSKDHKCDLCERCFYTDSELRHHRKAKHEAANEPDGKYTHICEFCGKHFAYRATLLMHMRTHTGEKPFTCSYCNKGFSQKGNLEEHEAIHTGNKPFVCDICAARFIRNSCLEKHMRMHTDHRPYICDLCPMAFRRKDTLNFHKESCHFDSRPFQCPLCDKTFRIRKALTIHTRIHTGERPFICSVCGRGFHDKSNMRKHTKVHQSDPTPISGPFVPFAVPFS